jgi:cytochrome oxidase assembly protein ShyY1
MATALEDSHERPAHPYRFLLRPKWIAFHLLVILLVIVMINLAFWQLRRLHERRQFNAEVRANAAQPIAPISTIDLNATDQSTIEWRRVEVQGTYVPDHQFLVVNRAQNGDNGRNVVDALQESDGTLLLINRGFLPITAPVPPPPSGTVTVVGTLRRSEHRKTGQPSDSSSPGLSDIHRIDIPLLRDQFDAPLAPLYVEQLTARPPDSKDLEPIPAPTLDEGPHLSYTIQWFIFSACTIAGWVLAVRRSAATRSGRPPKRRGSTYIPFADEESVP